MVNWIFLKLEMDLFSEPAEQVPTTSSTANNPAEESEENDQMPQLQPMLALPAPADWKPTEWRSSISGF